MTVNSPANIYSSGSNKLIWGLNYDFELNKNCSMSSPNLRFRDSSATNWQCYNLLYTNEANPYDDNPTLKADFSGTLIQDPWYQANGGGVISNSSVNDNVPVTCTETNSCVSQIGISGLVAAPFISNVGNPSYQNWFYGSTSGLSNNNAKLADYNTNYDYFYSQYFVKKAVGTTLINNNEAIDIINSGSDPNGIYFINDKLDINKDVINPGNFLMIIAKGKITVDQSVNRVDGILVASDIGASGPSDSPLIFNGSLYASNKIDFSRDFDTDNRIKNNSTPAVVVNYDPKLIFNMPGDIAKVLTNWQWGN